jgi:3,4-dihydroxy-2-butanone 4-phosphate synthase
VSEREAALGENEAVFREVNERIREITTYHRDAEFLCECADPTCAEPIALELDEYERVRRDAAQFLVVPGHDHPDVETVVSANDRFAVVRKKAGVPTEVAVETDPRA